jgi:hypothetical protein
MEDIVLWPEGQGPSTKSYFFYNGTVELRFNRESWSYHRVCSDGSLQPYDGVTKVVHIIDKSEVLIRWAVKKAMEKLKRLLQDRGYTWTHANASTVGEPLPLYEEILDEIIASAKKADKEELDAAAEIGHTAHDWIEKYIQSLLADKDDRRLELLAKFPADERAANACVAACQWMADHNVRWIATERRCCSLEHEYAGTMDGLARVDSCGNPDCCPNSFKDRLTLVDWKTSNHLYIEFLLQTGAYQHAHEEETGDVIEDRWIIRLGKEDAEFDPWHMEGRALYEQDFEGFLRCLDLCKSVVCLRDRIATGQATKVEARHAALQAIKEKLWLLTCPLSEEYKGIRKKKGCNGTETLCQTCEAKYAAKHQTIGNATSGIGGADDSGAEYTDPDVLPVSPGDSGVHEGAAKAGPPSGAAGA